jgi:hypothetical protein
LQHNEASFSAGGIQVELLLQGKVNNENFGGPSLYLERKEDGGAKTNARLQHLPMWSAG